MDNNKHTQSKGDQNSSSTITCEPGNETRHEHEESGNIQEVEEIPSREQETKEENGNNPNNILKSNPEKCDLDRNNDCTHSINSVCSEKVFLGGYSHCEFVDKTAGASKSNIHLLKRCSVVLNRCDEKTPKADAFPERKPHINRPLAGNGKPKNVRIAEGKYFRKKTDSEKTDDEAFVTMRPENEYKCSNMDVESSDFFNERRTQVSNCKGSSCNYMKRTNVKSAKRAQKEHISGEINEERSENVNVLTNATGEKVKRFRWSSNIASDQVSVINASKKELINTNKTFSSDIKLIKTCAIPKTTSESASRHKVAARRSSRRCNLKKHIGQEMNEDSEITEIIPTDPLLDKPSSNILNTAKEETGKLGSTKNNAIVVNNTEQLLQIASRKGIKRKKEPTLVIIDTNSILSGKGPVPISQISLTGPLPHSSVVTGYSVLPSGKGSWNNLTSGTPSQPVLQNLNQLTFSSSDKSNTSCTQISSLTASAVNIIDAPSFIVPCLYEQPPKMSFKKYIEQLQREIETSSYSSESDSSKDNSTNGMNNLNNEENTNTIQNNKKKKCDESDRDIESNSSINYEENANCPINKKKTSIFWNGNAINQNSNTSPDSSVRESTKVVKKLNSNDQEYFSSSLGTFFIQIGLGLVKEYVNTDLKRQSKKHPSKFVGKNQYSDFPLNNVDYRVEDNQPFHFKQKKCGYCNFQTESCLVMSYHLETPHLFNNVYKCNFCNLIIENRSQIVYHMIMLHDIRVSLECAPAKYQCPNCPFEDRSKSKLKSHKVSCLKKNKPDRNQEPPPNWEPPAKIRHIKQNPVSKRGKSTLSYQMNSKGVRQLLPKLPSNTIFHSGISAGHVAGSRDQFGVIQSHNSTSKNVPITGVWQRPNISITPLPNVQTLTSSAAIASKQGLPENSVSLLNKAQKLNICEICDSQFINFEKLQIHLRDIHHVKFSKKATYSTPSLGCQKCPLRFFTDQGLERHLLGNHGLVTASFQEAARNETDGGHCPICSKLFQWKLLEHMYREHKMSLKPVNISYKCTLCTTVTFEKYKQFEDHVFAVHSLSKSKKNPVVPSAPISGDLLKSLTKNNEITIISHDKQSRPKNSVKTSDTISLIQQRKKLEDVNIQQLRIKDIVERLEEKEQNNNLLTPEEVNIDSSCEEEKCINKDAVTKKNLKNNEISEDKKEHNFLKNTSNYSHQSEILVTDKNLLKNKRNNCISAKINDHEDIRTPSTTSLVHLSQQTHESCEDNKKSCGFFDSKPHILQCKNEIEDNRNPSSAEETIHQQVCDDKSSANECEMLNNFSDTCDGLKNSDSKKNHQEIECHKEVSVIDDSAFVHKNKGSDHVLQAKMKCQSVDCNKLLPQHVEIINLDDSPPREKIHTKDKNSEISKNSALINNQKENHEKKNSENHILEEHQIEDDTSNRTANFKNLEYEESVLSHTNLDDDSLPKLIPLIPKSNEEINSNDAKILAKDGGIEVIQLDDSLPEDKKEIETSDVLSNSRVN